MKVIASGHVADTLEAQIEEAKAIIDTGIDAYILISNRLAGEKGEEEVVKKNIESILRSIPETDFGIYECPYPYKRLVSPELLKWCAQTGRFAFLKDTCCNLEGLQSKIEATRGTRLEIYNANAVTLLESLKMGCAGYSSVMANFHAGLYTWLCKNFEKDPDKAQQLQNYLGLASAIECQVYPVNAKCHMQLEEVPVQLHSRVRD